MKKLKLFYGILIGILILSSCSSNDNFNSDIIIGKWRAIEKYETDQLVDLPTCLPHLYVEYKADNTVSGGKIISDNFPDECNSIISDLGVVWENLGNNTYRIGHFNEQGTVSTIYRDGENLVIESINGITKIKYEPF